MHLDQGHRKESSQVTALWYCQPTGLINWVQCIQWPENHFTCTACGTTCGPSTMISFREDYSRRHSKQTFDQIAVRVRQKETPDHGRLIHINLYTFYLYNPSTRYSKPLLATFLDWRQGDYLLHLPFRSYQPKNVPRQWRIYPLPIPKPLNISADFRI